MQLSYSSTPLPPLRHSGISSLAEEDGTSSILEEELPLIQSFATPSDFLFNRFFYYAACITLVLLSVIFIPAAHPATAWCAGAAINLSPMLLGKLMPVKHAPIAL